MLGTANLAQVLSSIGTSLRSGGPAEGFRSLFHKQRPVVYRCSVSFGTKFLHFAGYGVGLDFEPLIYDLFVARALARIPDAPYVPHPTERVTGDQYEAYCAWATAAASSRSTTPAVIEYALWEAGRQAA